MFRDNSIRQASGDEPSLRQSNQDYQAEQRCYDNSLWDKRIRSEKTDRFYETYRKPLQRWRRAEGFTQKDYALRNAAWHVTDILAELKEAEDRREGFLGAFSLSRPGGTSTGPVAGGYERRD